MCVRCGERNRLSLRKRKDGRTRKTKTKHSNREWERWCGPQKQQKKRKIQKRKMTDDGDDWDEFLTRSAVVCIRTHLLLFLEKSSPRERERVNPEQSVSPICYSVFVT